MDVKQIVGPHPLPSHPCGNSLTALDQRTKHNIPHRVLENDPLEIDEFIAAMAQWVVDHHVSPESVERDRTRREALKRQGFNDPTQRFPTNTSTQKGNWAEILLRNILPPRAMHNFLFIDSDTIPTLINL
jgi:hypothetical protein